MEITLGSLFDGIAGFPLSASHYGIVTKWASEIESFPIKVSQKHFPNMKHLGDVTKINGAEIEPVDIISFGSPCFPAGTLVITEKGYMPIEEINVGDRVLTHTGKWQKVLKVGNKIADTIILKGFGHYGLETTTEHPFYSSEKIRKWRNEPSRGWDSEMTNPKWSKAQHMEGKFWATPIITEIIEIPDIKKSLGKGKRAEIPEMNEPFWWFIGRWLGDGWTRDAKRLNRPMGWGQVFICSSHDEADGVQEKIGHLGIIWARFEERTVTKFRTTNQALTKWILDNFGQHAGEKRLPSWILSLSIKYRQSLLDGYISADGFINQDGAYSATTVSKKLGLGIRLVAESLGFASALYFSKTKPKTTIEGRVVNQRDFYTVRYATIKKQTSRTEAYGVSWGKVRKVSEGRKSIRVYNIEVGEDNSYVVENIIVHNCQDMSVAGKREGLGGARSGLFMEAVRIIREMREATNGVYPRVAIWENVPGAFSSNGGQDFRAVLEEITETEISIPPSGRWAESGMVRGDGRSVAWRVLDAQYWGVPQRRKRIFLVADFGGQRAGEILFEREGMSGHSEESGKAWEEVAAGVGDGINTTSRINCTPDGIAGTVSSKWAKGTGGPAGDEHYNLVCQEEIKVNFEQTSDRIAINPKTSVTLKASGGGGGAKTGLYLLPIAFNGRQDPISGPIPGALGASLPQAQCVATGYTTSQFAKYVEGVGTLRASGGDLGGGSETLVVNYRVRRLTPTECLRLQGFPDNWLDIEGASDSGKYKATGNSVAIPCVEFIFSQIVKVLERKD